MPFAFVHMATTPKQWQTLLANLIVSHSIFKPIQNGLSGALFGRALRFLFISIKTVTRFPGCLLLSLQKKNKKKNKHNTQEWKGDQVNKILFRSPKIGLQHLKSRHIKVGYFIASAIIQHNELCILLLQLYWVK